METDYEFKYLIIKEYKYWRIELFSNQCYLGRCIIMYNNGKQINDLFDTSVSAFTELYYVAKILRNSLRRLFNPNMFNYTAMGNVLHRLHVHVFPRYKKPVEFGGKLFKDENWGAQPYSYDDETFEISNDLIKKIMSAIRKELDRESIAG